VMGDEDRREYLTDTLKEFLEEARGEVKVMFPQLDGALRPSPPPGSLLNRRVVRFRPKGPSNCPRQRRTSRQPLRMRGGPEKQIIGNGHSENRISVRGNLGNCAHERRSGFGIVIYHLHVEGRAPGSLIRPLRVTDETPLGVAMKP